MSDFTSADWIWILNTSMFIFCMLDGFLHGRDQIRDMIITDNLNKSWVTLTFVITCSFLIAILYYVLFVWVPPTLTLVILLFETASRVYNNYNSTKSLTDYDEDE